VYKLQFCTCIIVNVSPLNCGWLDGSELRSYISSTSIRLEQRPKKFGNRRHCWKLGIPFPNLPVPWGTGPLSNIVSTPNLDPLPVGDWGPCLIYNVTLIGTTRVSLPNGISFRPTPLVLWQTTYTYRRTDHATVTCVAIEKETTCKTVVRLVTCKIKHLQKRFRAVDFSRLCRGRKSVVKMFYFTCNHLLCSTCVQHAKTLAKHLQKCFSVLFYTCIHL